MRRSGGTLFGILGVLVAPLLVACGSANDPGLTGDPVDATPRALAAVLIDHVDAEPRRETGSWSDYNDPLAIGAQVDFGVDPEGAESGRTKTVRIDVGKRAAYSSQDRASFTCLAAEPRCEQLHVDGTSVEFRWDPGTEEEEPGTYAWTVVRDDEVVRVGYEGSGLFDADPRTLDLPIDPDQLRAAALDPAMSLRTTSGAVVAGRALKNYRGQEDPPVEPTVTSSTYRQLAAEFEHSADLRATSVRPSTRTEFGPHAIGAHLQYVGTHSHEPFGVDVLSAVGKVRALDPAPCGEQHSETAVRDRCFGLGDGTFVTWQLATDGRPGVIWILSSTYDEDFNRVESSGIRFESTGITQNLYDDANPDWSARFPIEVWSNVLNLTFRPEARVATPAS